MFDLESTKSQHLILCLQAEMKIVLQLQPHMIFENMENDLQLRLNTLGKHWCNAQSSKQRESVSITTPVSVVGEDKHSTMFLARTACKFP